MTISVPEVLYRYTEHTAHRLGMTRSELCRRALRTFLKRHDGELITEKLNAVYGPSTAYAQLEPVPKALENVSFEREEWH